MAGYEDTRQKIISTLMGRPNGTEIQPENHQDYALNMLDYIRSLELIATSTLIGVAESNSTPVQPNDSRVCYIAGVAQNQTVTFENFIGENGNPISVTTGDMEGVFVILMWNTQYWSAQTFITNIISQSESATFYYRYNIRKTYESIALMNADVESPIGTDGKYIKVGDIVTVVNSTTPSENGIYSYEGATDGWKFQSSFNFQVEQIRSQNENTSPSSKLLDDELVQVSTDLNEVSTKLDNNLSLSETITITYKQKDNLLPIDGSIASNNAFKLYYIPVKAGDKFKVNFTYSNDDGVYYGYTSTEPVLNTSATNCYAKLFSQYVNTEITALVDGYYVVGLEYAHITSEVIFTKNNTGLNKRLSFAELNIATNTSNIINQEQRLDTVAYNFSEETYVVKSTTKLTSLVCLGGTIYSDSGFNLYYLPIKAGDRFKVSYVSTDAYGTAYYAFTATLPANNVVISNENGRLLNKDFNNKEYTSPVDGFLVVSIELSYITGDPTISFFNNGIAIQIKNINKTIKPVTIGAGGDFSTVKDGFEYAHINNIDEVIILPGEYDLVSEGIENYTFYKYNNPNYKAGYFAPKRIIGYGATLICRLLSPNWEISPINLFYGSSGTEVYGLTIICANCRYNIHDEMWNMASFGSTYYHNIFKDLTLIHESAPTETLIKPINIGGGFGDHGDILIENCVLTSQSDVNIDYHSKAGGVAQTASCKTTVKDCVLNKTISATGSGTSTAYLNKVYVYNCLCGSLPVAATNYNMQLIPYNNVIQ